MRLSHRVRLTKASSRRGPSGEGVKQTPKGRHGRVVSKEKKDSGDSSGHALRWTRRYRPDTTGVTGSQGNVPVFEKKKKKPSGGKTNAGLTVY